MTIGRPIRFVVPAGVDDPRRVSGGNIYDRHVRDGLGAHGWAVETVEVRDGEAAASALAQAPRETPVLIDGLVAGWAPAAVEAAALRRRVTVLAHMVVAAFPDASDAAVDAERRVLTAAAGVIVPSTWAAHELGRRGLAAADRVTIARPGAHPVDAAPAPRAHADLLCIGVIAPHKGQDLLLSALADLGRLADAEWTCTIAGSAEPHPDFAAAIAEQAASFGARVDLPGVLDDTALRQAYRRSAVLVAPSRVESAGMAIADALAHGLPVIAAATGGIPETVAGGGALLVPPDDAAALAGALGEWMSDPALRDRLRREALAARIHLPRWDDTVAAAAGGLEPA